MPTKNPLRKIATDLKSWPSRLYVAVATFAAEAAYRAGAAAAGWIRTKASALFTKAVESVAAVMSR